MLNEYFLLSILVTGRRLQCTGLLVQSSRECTPKDPVQIDAGPLPSSAWAGWIWIDSEVEAEAANIVPYRRLMLRAVQLLSELYASYTVKEDYDVTYSTDGVH